ncbi:MAG: response regulator transcription factor [Culicoidibacterales bacterium]
MFKLAIIDDEKFIVAGLQILIDWQSLGIEVVCATTKVEAVLAIKEQLDFLLTDVQMPTMSGIELVSKVKAENPAVECVILSGYDDFTFAQQGMQVGVSNYLLKPVVEAEMIRTFEKLVIRATERQQKQKIIKQQLYYQLLDNPEIIALSALLSSKPMGRAYYLFSAKTTQALVIDGRFTIEWLFEQPKVIGICLFEPTDSVEVKRQLASSGVQLISSIGYGDADFSQCFERLHELVVFDENKTMIWEELETQTFDFVQALEQMTQFQNLLMQADYQKPQELIALELSNTYTRAEFENLALLYVIALQQFTAHQHLDFDAGGNKMAPQLLAELNKLATGQAVVEQLCEWTTAIHEQFHQKITNYTPIIRRVMKIIEQDYNQDISLKTLSHQLNMNASYLGQIFKEEVGISFNFYINKMRMEKAQDLLLNSNWKINQIAQHVGFQDNSYFYRKFKNYYGYCPNTVRKNQ